MAMAKLCKREQRLSWLTRVVLLPIAIGLIACSWAGVYVVDRQDGTADMLNHSIELSSLVQRAKLLGEGTTAGPDPIDNEARLFGIHKVPGFPLLVLTGISEPEMMRQGSLSRYSMITVGMVLTVLVGLLMATLQLKRKLD